tara:strand:+ start:208 stop:783 length:576 start_codon:yes stop_codon:yes gene_type:complete
MSASITQKTINGFYNDALNGIRNSPIQVRKTSTKLVYIPILGEHIDTYIDGDNGSIIKEVSRSVPTDEPYRTYIVICTSLKNSTTKYQQYFIPFSDFIQRYTFMNGDYITDSHKSVFSNDIRSVRAKGTAIAFKSLVTDSSTGEYEQPPSWGQGIASGSNQEGYWMASTQQPDEYYFMPIQHFNNDYILDI